MPDKELTLSFILHSSDFIADNNPATVTTSLHFFERQFVKHPSQWLQRRIRRSSEMFRGLWLCVYRLDCREKARVALSPAVLREIRCLLTDAERHRVQIPSRRMSICQIFGQNIPQCT